MVKSMMRGVFARTVSKETPKKRIISENVQKPFHRAFKVVITVMIFTKIINIPLGIGITIVVMGEIKSVVDVLNIVNIMDIMNKKKMKRVFHLMIRRIDEWVKRPYGIFVVIVTFW